MRLGGRSIVFAAMALTLVAGCAKAGGAGLFGDSQGQTLRLDRSDNGSTVAAHVGDRLVLSLGVMKPATWELSRYPHDLLSIISTDVGVGHFVFDVRETGRAQVVVTAWGICEGPLPTRTAAGIGCPVAGPDEPTDLIGHRFPVTIFTVTLTVS